MEMNIKKKLKTRVKYNHYSHLTWQLHELLININGVDFSKSFCKGGHPWAVYKQEGDE